MIVADEVVARSLDADFVGVGCTAAAGIVLVGRTAFAVLVSKLWM